MKNIWGDNMMNDMGYMSSISDRKETVLGISTILYCIMCGATAEIHTSVGKVYKT